jgi:hypothetical protein
MPTTFKVGGKMFAEIIRTQAGDIILKTPFVEKFIDEMKIMVPKRYRVWQPIEKVWLIDEFYADEIKQLVGWYFPDVETIDLARAAMMTAIPSWAKTLHIQPDAPQEVTEAAYRALSKLHHPDRGGSTEKMKQINAAMEQARQRSY